MPPNRLSGRSCSPTPRDRFGSWPSCSRVLVPLAGYRGPEGQRRRRDSQLGCERSKVLFLRLNSPRWSLRGSRGSEWGPRGWQKRGRGRAPARRTPTAPGGCPGPKQAQNPEVARPGTDFRANSEDQLASPGGSDLVRSCGRRVALSKAVVGGRGVACSVGCGVAGKLGPVTWAWGFEGRVWAPPGAGLASAAQEAGPQARGNFQEGP